MSADEVPTPETRQTASGDVDPDALDVVDRPDAGRWELRRGSDVLGFAQYAIVPGSRDAAERVVFFHTEVDPAYEGQGLAAVLARRALDATIASGRTIVAICPYVRAWVKRHPDPYAGHTAAATRADVEAMQRAVGGAAPE